MTISIAQAIETQNSFFEREIKLFPVKKFLITFLHWVLASYRRKIDSLLDETYTHLLGALVVLKDYTKQQAQQELPLVKRAIKLLVSYKGHLEKAEYLGSKDLEEKINMVISALYDAEILMKKKAFAGEHRVATHPELVQAVTSASKKAIQSSLNR